MGTKTKDLFGDFNPDFPSIPQQPETVTLENILNRIRKYNKRISKSSRHINGLAIDNSGNWFNVLWSNGDIHSFPALDTALTFMDKNIPKVIG